MSHTAAIVIPQTVTLPLTINGWTMPRSLMESASSWSLPPASIMLARITLVFPGLSRFEYSLHVTEQATSALNRTPAILGESLRARL